MQDTHNLFIISGINLLNYSTVWDLKQKINRQENILTYEQCLIWKGNELMNDHLKLSEYNIEKGSTLVLRHCISA